ncbi:MAG: prepilin-type N-terminal cleavage/methylation domain-containing protein [Pseudomonadota bacterium]
MSGRSSRQSGFTLLELMIAVAVLAVVLVVVYQSYRLCTKTVIAAEEQSEVYQSARIVLRRLGEDLMSAYLPLASPDDEEGDEETPDAGPDNGPAFVAVDGGSGAEAHDSLEFASTANLARGAAGQAELVVVHYALEPRGKEGRLSLVRSTDADPEGSQGVEMAPNVKGLDFRFFNATGEEFQEWDSTDSHALPATVQIVLTLGGEGDEPGVTFTTAVAIPLAWQREALGRGLAALAAEEAARAKDDEALRRGGQADGHASEAPEHIGHQGDENPNGEQ